MNTHWDIPSPPSPIMYRRNKQSTHNFVQAVQARREAQEQLERLLQSVDDLNKLDPLRQEYTTQRQTARDQLRNTLSIHIERLKNGLESLHRSEIFLTKFKTSFAAIDDLCNECSSLVECTPALRSLSAVHSNIKQTLHGAEAVAGLPEQARNAEKLLQDDSPSGLLHAFACVAELEATATRIQAALESVVLQSPQRAQQIPSLETYFAQVRHAQARVEEKIWSIVRNFKSIAKNNSALLVSALQCIEIQEMVDMDLLTAGQGGSKLRKGWRRRCILQLSASVQESFAPVLQRGSKILASGSSVDDILQEILDGASALLHELWQSKKYVAPCFPPQYGAFDRICGEYREQINNLIDLLGLATEQLSNGNIITVMKWVGKCENALKEMDGRSRKDAALGGGSGESGISLLIGTYIARVGATLDSWVSNIVSSDFGTEPRATSDGRMWTPGPVDLFRILDEQLKVAADAGGVLLLQVAMEVQRTLETYQHSTRSRVLKSGKRALALETLCAVGNNSQRCEALGKELASVARTLLGSEDGEEGEADILLSCNGFQDLGDVSVSACVSAVFSDPGFGELFGRVASSDAWVSGTVTGSVIATLDDFLHDFRRWFHPALYSDLIMLVLAECVAHFIAATTTQLRTVRDEDLRALRRDSVKLVAFFGSHMSRETVTMECQPLSDICEFLASDSIEAFVLSYTTLLESAPGITPALISNLLQARVASDADMTKADAKEILEACREVYAARPAIFAASNTAKSRTTIPGRDTAFVAALNAARRRADRND